MSPDLAGPEPAAPEAPLRVSLPPAARRPPTRPSRPRLLLWLGATLILGLGTWLPRQPAQPVPPVVMATVGNPDGLVSVHWPGAGQVEVDGSPVGQLAGPVRLLLSVGPHTVRIRCSQGVRQATVHVRQDDTLELHFAAMMPAP